MCEGRYTCRLGRPPSGNSEFDSKEHADDSRSFVVAGKCCHLNTMDKLDQANTTSKSLHYSIPALLWIGHLCETNKTPFDLSRLSFAVFHGKNTFCSEHDEQSVLLRIAPFLFTDFGPSPAGFVKPSGAYARGFAMPLQDISVNRNRGWSLDTASSAEEYGAFSGSDRRLLEPRRQPVNAPGSPGGRGQVDAGFVRFLKKHSSPTHQRVTAGGRIVPMERPSAPPPFKVAVDNSNHGRTNPTTRQLGDGSLCRKQRLENNGSVMYSGLRNGSCKPFNPNANFHLGQDQRLLMEPSPKYYDGQTGQENCRNAAITQNKAGLDEMTSTERNVSLPAPQSSSAGQNTTTSTARALERSQPTSMASRANFVQPRQARLPVHETSSTAQASADRQYPPNLRASQQQTFVMPNTTNFALDGVSTAMSPDPGYNAQGVNQPHVNGGLGPYYGLDLGANQAVLYPSLFPIMPQGFQVSPFASLPTYSNHLGFVPPAYHASEPFNTSAPLMSPLAMQSFPGISTPLAPPDGLSAAVCQIPTQLELEQELASAEADFNNSTEKERTLDQYLAMHMDKIELQTRRALTGKRMQIVEERAAARDRINQAVQALNAESARTTNMMSDGQSVNSPWSARQNHSANRLNVQAPSWVPKAGTDGKQAVIVRNPNPLTSTASSSSWQKISPSQTNIDGPRLSPPKPTTNISEDPFVAQQTTVIFSPEKSPVDEWGARLGAAPPELQRQQSEQSEWLESMASEASRASRSPQKSSGDYSEPAGSWEAREGRAPPQVEADHEQYLDAIRKDHGTTSVLTLSSGRMVEVEGQNYKQPELEYMSTNFEKDYWFRKPDRDRRWKASQSRPFERSFENIMRTPPQKSQQTEEWVNGIVDVQKPTYSGRAPWIADGMNLLSTKAEPSVSLQDEHATSKTRGAGGAAGHLRGRR